MFVDDNNNLNIYHLSIAVEFTRVFTMPTLLESNEARAMTPSKHWQGKKDNKEMCHLISLTHALPIHHFTLITSSSMTHHHCKLHS